MARRETFTIQEMKDALEKSGGNQAQAAELLGVQPPAVSKRMRKLNFGVANSVELYHAGEMVRERINFNKQIIKLNKYANAVLDSIMRAVKAPTDKQVEKIKKLQPLIGENGTLLDFALKYKAEIRKQMQLAIQSEEKVIIFDKLARAQAIILERIGVASPEVRDDIYQELVRANALLSTIG